MNEELDGQCDKLIQLLKKKEQQAQENGRNSHHNCCKGEKVTLGMIKQQYNENITLTKEFFR